MMKKFFTVLLLLVNLPVMAQEDLLRAAFQGVAEIGKQWNGEVNAATQALYTPLHQQVDDEGLILHADIAYGDHPLQTFDLWVSEHEFREGGPVGIYFHGGGLVRGDKVSAETDNLIYSNIGKFIARVGGIGINANYRLAPEAKFPDGATDLRLIIQWVKENIAEYGGNPDNVFLMGNSAGSTHVATYLFHEVPVDAEKGLLLITGRMPQREKPIPRWDLCSHTRVNRCRCTCGVQNTTLPISKPVSLGCMPACVRNMQTVPCLRNGRATIMSPMS